MSDLIIPNLSEKFAKMTPKKVQPSSLSQRSVLSLVTYIQSIQYLTFKQLQTLKHAILHSTKTPHSALRKQHRKNKNVQFCEFVIQKERQNIYLTKLVDEDSQDQWKYKTILDTKIFNSLEKDLPVYIEKCNNRVQQSFSTTQSFTNALHKNPQNFSDRRNKRSSIRHKKKTLFQIYRFNILIFIDDVPNIFIEPRLSNWNPYISGIFAFLNQNRNLLKNILRQDIQNGKYFIKLYNNKFQLEEEQIIAFFQDWYDNEVCKFTQPFACRNGKLQIWNTLTDKAFKQKKVRGLLYGKHFIQMLLGVPVQIENVQNFNSQRIQYFIRYNYKRNVIFAQNKTQCFHIFDIKNMNIGGNYYLLLILNSFQKNLTFSIKFSQIYKSSSQTFKMYIQKLQLDNKIAVLFQDLLQNIKYLYLSTIIQNLALRNFCLDPSQSIILQSFYSQTVIFQLPQQYVSQQTVILNLQKRTKNIYKDQDILVLGGNCYNIKNIKGNNYYNGKRVIYQTLQQGKYKISCSSDQGYNSLTLNIFSDLALKIWIQK